MNAAMDAISDDTMTYQLAQVIGQPTSSPWREEALGRIAEMCTLLGWVESKLESPDPRATAARAHLKVASEGVHTRASLWSRINGAAYQRVMANIDAAQANLLRIAPPDYVQSNMTNCYMQVQARLSSDDPRLTQLAALEREAGLQDLGSEDRSIVVAAVQGAADQARSDQQKARSFRNVILTTALLTAALAVIVAVVGWRRPDAFPVCFVPGDEVVCPTNQVPLPGGTTTSSQTQPIDTSVINATTAKAVQESDIALIEFVGLLGAAVAAAVSLREIRKAADPHSLSVALALLKVVTGALTAFLGLLLIRAGFVPGLSALDSSAQIIAWAIILGYAQQLFTRAIDRQAATVLEKANPQLQPIGRSAGERPRLTQPSPGPVTSSSAAVDAGAST